MKIYAVMAFILYLATPAVLADTCPYKSKYEKEVGLEHTKSCACVSDESKYPSRVLNNGLKLVMVCDYHRMERKENYIDWGSFHYSGDAEIKVKISIGRSLSYDGPTPKPYVEQHYSIDSHDGKIWNIKLHEDAPYKTLNFNKVFPKKYKKCESWWISDAVIRTKGLVVADYDADDAGSSLKNYKIKNISEYRSWQPESECL